MRYLLFLLIILAGPLQGIAQEKTDAAASAAPDQDSKAEAQDPKPELSDMELIERVAFLQRQLEATSIPKRDEAQKELLTLGVRVLDYLEPPTDKTPTDAIQRTTAVRTELEKIAVAAVTKSSSVTLSGKMTLGEAFNAIRDQTGNDVDLLGETPDFFVDKEIELKLENTGFWEALAEVQKQGELVIDPYGGGPGQLRLTPTRAAQLLAANPGMQIPKDQQQQVTDIPRCTSEIFDIAVTSVSSHRNLRSPDQNYCNISLMVHWEPRVTPISIDMPANKIIAIDEFDSPIKLNNQEAVFSGLVQPEVSNLEFSIPIARVDRQVETIKSFEATIDAVLPGRSEKFRFRKIGKLKPGASQTKAGATVSIDGIKKNEDLFGVTVRLSFDEEHNALESHQNWVYNNPIHLVDDDGEKLEALAFEGVKQTNNEVAIRYYFDQDPKNMTLHYATPAAIVRIPVLVKIKNIPLP